MATIAVMGTLDSKGPEHEFVAARIRSMGYQTLLIDVGTTGQPSIIPDVSCEEAAAAAGVDLQRLRQRRDRGECVRAMAVAAPEILLKLYREGRIQGVISLGGSSGTAIASSGMRALPTGFPKLMVSTMASGNIAPYVGTKDIVMMPAVVDVAGLNRISRVIFARAAGAICGMVSAEISAAGTRPLIAASMFGNTTDCINAATPLLEQAGYEVLVFHANGTGGRTMESLIESGLIRGVLDITTTELADELVGGVLTAGCLDMVNFGEQGSVPRQFFNRLFYSHNPQVTLMRTTPEECQRLGAVLAEKVNASVAPVTVMIPLQGISVISAVGGPFHDPAADSALFNSLANTLRPGIRVVKVDATINAPEFAQACVRELLANMSDSRSVMN
jgi:uncharacterized protein (UPF0261 family)